MISRPVPVLAGALAVAAAVTALSGILLLLLLRPVLGRSAAA